MYDKAKNLTRSVKCVKNDGIGLRIKVEDNPT